MFCKFLSVNQLSEIVHTIQLIDKIVPHIIYCTQYSCAFESSILHLFLSLFLFVLHLHICFPITYDGFGWVFWHYLHYSIFNTLLEVSISFFKELLYTCVSHYSVSKKTTRTKSTKVSPCKGFVKKCANIKCTGQYFISISFLWSLSLKKLCLHVWNFPCMSYDHLSLF